MNIVFNRTPTVSLPATITIATPFQLLGDLNQDGTRDLIIFQGHPAGAQPSIYDGTQSGRLLILTFPTGDVREITNDVLSGPLPQLVTVNGMLARDFNGDGRTDLFICDDGIDFVPFSGGTRKLLLSGVDGRLAASTQSLSGPSFAHSVTTADIDGDGDLDIFVGGIASNEQPPHFLMNNGLGTFSQNVTRLPKTVSDTYIGTSTGAIAYQFMDSRLADFNRDGSPDLLLLPKWSTDRPYLYLNDGQGNFSDARKIGLPDGLYGTGSQVRKPDGSGLEKGTGNWTHSVADLNGDGYLDVIAAQVAWDDNTGKKYFSGQLQILVNNAGKGFTDETGTRLVASPLGAQNFTNYFDPQVVDLNGDGRPDLVVNVISAKGEYSNKVFVNTDGRLIESADFSAPGLLFPVDTNGDGRIDLVNLNYVIAGSTSQGLGLFTPQVTTYLNSQATLRLSGSDGIDSLQGTSGHDVLRGLGGDDVLDGGGGIDTAVFIGAKGENRLSGKGAELTVAGLDGVDLLLNVERLKFSDVALAMDIAGNAGVVAKALGAVFGSESVGNSKYVGIGLSLMDSGMSPEALMQVALNARLGVSHSVGAAVTTLYKNVVGVDPNASELQFYTDFVTSGQMNEGQLGLLAANTTLNAVNINLIGLASAGIEYI